MAPEKDVSVRNHNTWQSSALAESDPSQVRERFHNTWSSTAFAGAKYQPTGHERNVIMSGKSHGYSALFGDEKSDFTQSSKNPFINAANPVDAAPQAD